MITRGIIQEVHDYRLSSAVSQSYLRDIVMKGKPIKAKFRESVTGDVVDMYLTLPDEVEDFYTTYEDTVPSDKLSDILTKTMEYLLEKGDLTPDIRRYRGLILKIASEEKFDMNKSDATKFKQIEEKAGKWWEFVTESWGKNVITEKERSFGAQIAELTMRHKVSAAFFQDATGRDFYYQVARYFTHNGVECKMLPDILIVSHVKNTIYIVDIKTIFLANTFNISQHIKQYNYPDQLSFYENGIQYDLKSLGAEGYKIETLWLFIPKDIRDEGKYFNPILWPCTEEMKTWSRWGGIYKSGNVYKTKGHFMESEKEVKGWEHGIEMYRKAVESKSSIFGIHSSEPITNKQSNQLYFT